jgi:hypothetical protein
VLLREDKTRELLAVEAGHWSGPEIIQRTKSMYNRFGASMVVVETVAAQAYLAQWLRELGSIRVEGYTTGKGKLSLEYRCEQVGAELARRQWIFPSIEVPGASRRPRDKEIGLLVKDLAYYSPSAHTPDRVSALCMAQWGCERVGSTVGWVPLPAAWNAR